MHIKCPNCGESRHLSEYIRKGKNMFSCPDCGEVFEVDI